MLVKCEINEATHVKLNVTDSWMEEWAANKELINTMAFKVKEIATKDNYKSYELTFIITDGIRRATGYSSLEVTTRIYSGGVEPDFEFYKVVLDEKILDLCNQLDYLF